MKWQQPGILTGTCDWLLVAWMLALLMLEH